MNSKQLANVLIKILGLSMFLYAIPGFFSEILIFSSPFWSTTGASSNAYDTMVHQVMRSAVSFAVREVVEIGIGLFIIVKSRKIAEFLFKREAE